jgi:hypothetical protein
VYAPVAVCLAVELPLPGAPPCPVEPLGGAPGAAPLGAAPPGGDGAADWAVEDEVVAAFVALDPHAASATAATSTRTIVQIRVRRPRMMLPPSGRHTLCR